MSANLFHTIFLSLFLFVAFQENHLKITCQKKFSQRVRKLRLRKIGSTRVIGQVYYIITVKYKVAWMPDKLYIKKGRKNSACPQNRDRQPDKHPQAL